MAKHSVLFVCWGNICRSSIAEAVFRKLLEERSLQQEWNVDSAGTGEWNLGQLADHRALKVLRKKGLDSEHRARLLTKEDFERYEHIICMDHKNIADMKPTTPPGTEQKVKLLGPYDSQLQGEVIEDPYYGQYEDFETVYEICVRACTAFLDSVY